MYIGEQLRRQSESIGLLQRLVGRLNRSVQDEKPMSIGLPFSLFGSFNILGVVKWNFSKLCVLKSVNCVNFSKLRLKPRKILSLKRCVYI